MDQHPDSPGPAGRTMPATASEVFGDFAVRMRLEDLPAPVRQEAVLHALDTVGVGIAAAVLPGEADSARASMRVAAALGGESEASVYGMGMRLPAPAAAYANAALQHSLDFDDIHTDSRVHASTMTVPAAMAVGERVRASGGEVLAAIVVANEIACRIGMGGPRHVQLHGFHGTPVCGVFGTAAAAGRLLGLGPDLIAEAIGIAADVSGGTNAWTVEGTTNKHLHAGWAAQNGILSALLAQQGAHGPMGSLEGRFGFYEALTGAENVPVERITADLGQQWKTAEMAYKAFPSCYWMHASVEAAGRLRERVLRDLDEIELIEAIVPTAAVPLVLEPRGTRIRPLTPYAGKFSLYYSVAAMILRGTVSLETYTPAAMGDRAVLALAERIGYRVSDDLDRSRQLYPGGLRVRFADGTELVEIVEEPLGSPLNPMSQEELLEKFRVNARFGLSDSETDELEGLLLGIENLADLREIGRLMRAVSPR